MIQRILFATLLAVGTMINGSCQVNDKIVGKKILLRDEGKSQLSYEDLDSPKNSWYQAIPPGRDLQLVGKGRVLIGTGMGYEERDIHSGQKLGEISNYEGTLSARRLRNGNTLLTGINWQGHEGIVCIAVDGKGNIKKKVVYPGFNYVRLVRETSRGTFLITSNTIVFEGDENGAILWQATLGGPEKQNSWQAIGIADGQTIISSGYGACLRILSKDGKQLSTITGPAEVNPHFYAGMQILSNGNILVTNWQAHGEGHGASGVQLLEYNRAGELVWSWRQNPARYSSLQGVILLDGLDVNWLHVEDENGILAPVR